MIQVPARMIVHKKSPFITVTFPEPAKTFWDDVCKAFREAAKSNPNYGLPVDNGGVNGRTNTDEVIQIKNLGKWLFGAPGYKGHVMYEPITATEFRVHYPDGAPTEAIQILRDITAEAVVAKCRWWGNTDYQNNWMVNTIQ